MSRLGLLLLIGLRDVLALFATTFDVKVSNDFLVNVARGNQ